MTRTIAGIYPATVTPFGSDGFFSPDAMRKIIRHQLNAGVDGFYLCGGTGEGLLLTREEREAALECVIDEVDGSAGVIAHVGAFQTAETLALTRHASLAGADAIAALPPSYFYKPDHLGLVQYYTAVAEASDLPLLIYNIPQRTGVAMTEELFEEMLALPNVIGMKDSTGDIEALETFLKIGDNPVIFEGEDTAVLPALKAGAAGGVGATYNMMPQLFVKLHRALKAGDTDTAESTQARITEIIMALLEVDVISGVKQIVNWMGLECGEGRTPNRSLTDEEKSRLRNALNKVGFFDE